MNASSKSGAKRASRLLVGLGLTLLSMITFMIVTEVFLRKIMDMTIGGADELAGYFFAAFVVLAFAFSAIERANIRVDVFHRVLPKALARLIDVLSPVSILVFSVPLTIAAIKLAVNSFEKGTRAISPMATPLYIPQGIWSAFLVFFVLVLIVISARAAVAFARGRLDDVEDIVGSRSEIESTGTKNESRASVSGAEKDGAV